VAPDAAVQLMRKADGTWRLEQVNCLTLIAKVTLVNTAMAEALLVMLFEGDTALEKFCSEFPFLKWKKTKVNPGR
jgi:hypothetical protein